MLQAVFTLEKKVLVVYWIPISNKYCETLYVSLPIGPTQPPTFKPLNR